MCCRMYISFSCLFFSILYIISYLLLQLINDLRTSLKWPTATNDQNVANSQKAVFDCIARSLTRSKKLFDIWLKSIAQQVDDPAKPIDFIILLIMMSINDEKRNYIENIVSVRFVLLVSSSIASLSVADSTKN